MVASKKKMVNCTCSSFQQSHNGVDDVGVNRQFGLVFFRRWKSGLFPIVDRMQKLHLLDDGAFAGLTGAQ